MTPPTAATTRANGQRPQGQPAVTKLVTETGARRNAGGLPTSAQMEACRAQFNSAVEVLRQRGSRRCGKPSMISANEFALVLQAGSLLDKGMPIED